MWTRRRIIAAAAAAAGITILLVIWTLVLPAMVRGRVEQAAARRGLSVTVGTVYAGLTEVVLSDVEVVDRGRKALRVTAGELRMDAGIFSLASSGTAAIEELELSEVNVAVSLDARELPRILRRLRGRSDAEAGGAGRIVRVEDLAVALHDRRGALFRLHRGQLFYQARRQLRLSGGPVELAPDERDGARTQQLLVRLERRGGDWKIGSAAVSGVEVRYTERGAGEHSPLWARIRGHARRLAGSAVSGSEPSGSSQESAASEAGALFGRARALIGPRLAPGAVLSLRDLSVFSRAGAERRTVLRDLSAEVRTMSAGRYLLTGSGRPGRGGRLGWRLTVHPADLWAVGNLDFQRVPFVLLAPVLPSLPWYRPEDARLSGELRIQSQGATRLHLDGEVSVDELALSSRRIAPQPVRRISVGFAGTADWNPITRRLDVARASLTVGRAQVHFAGSLEWPEDHYLIDLRATLPPTDCNTAVEAIPADLLADLGAFAFDGEIGGRLQVRIDSRDLDATVLDVHVSDACQFVATPSAADVYRFTGPFTHRVVEPDGSVFEMETGPGTAAWTPFEHISPFLVSAVLGHEDGGFYGHHGFSVGAIRLALIRNLRAGRYVQGASTITMQLVKNVFLHREKTLARKVQEVLLTWWIESVMPKDRILELYLNVIEYGPGIYGIRNAAWHYFGRAPAQLGPAESAYLATILPNPKAYHYQWVQQTIPENFRQRVARFLRTLGTRGRYDQATVDRGLAELATLGFSHNAPLPTSPDQPEGTAPTGPEREWEQAVGPDNPGVPPPPDEW